MSIRTLVITKFYGPTNTRGARIKVTLPSGRSKFIFWDYGNSVSENHATAAIFAHYDLTQAGNPGACMAKLIDSFHLPNESGMAHVLEVK